MGDLPPAFMIIAAITIILVVLPWAYRGVIASKNAQIELLDRQLADCRDTLERLVKARAADYGTSAAIIEDEFVREREARH